jgi:L-threonylcarbamoyladenylate synthase
MDTKILKLEKNNINEYDIFEAGTILRNGGLVAFPTETVYGLGANALDEDAARKTYAAKGRPSDNPLIVHIADYQDLERIVSQIPMQTKQLADAFWPGPLTMVFEKSECVPYGTTGGLDTVAVRMPSDPIAQQVIRAAGGYVSAPSANTSGRPSPTTAQHVEEDLNGKIDLILDGGMVDIGLESTIVDMTTMPPMVLRPGAITVPMLEEVIGQVQVDQVILHPESKVAPKAPGMKYRHYAPKAKLCIVEGTLGQEVLAIRQLAYAAHRKGKQVGILATAETEVFYTHGLVKNIGSRENERSIARNLYGVLRAFDEEEITEIYSESFALKGMGTAIMNRLEKAAGHTCLEAAPIVAKQKYRRILFLSNTDTSRGPMAAELFRQQELEQEYVIDSRGLVVLFPEPANQKAEAIMKSGQMTLEHHTSVLFTEDDLLEDTLVLTMDDTQKRKIVAEYENAKNVYTLSEYVEDEREIPNPYGQPLTAYGECYEMLMVLTQKLADKLNALTEEGGEECQKYM